MSIGLTLLNQWTDDVYIQDFTCENKSKKVLRIRASFPFFLSLLYLFLILLLAPPGPPRRTPYGETKTNVSRPVDHTVNVVGFWIPLNGRRLQSESLEISN